MLSRSDDIPKDLRKVELMSGWPILSATERLVPVGVITRRSHPEKSQDEDVAGEHIPPRWSGLFRKGWSCVRFVWE